MKAVFKPEKKGLMWALNMNQRITYLAVLIYVMYLRFYVLAKDYRETPDGDRRDAIECACVADGHGGRKQLVSHALIVHAMVHAMVHGAERRPLIRGGWEWDPGARVPFWADLDLDLDVDLASQLQGRCT